MSEGRDGKGWGSDYMDEEIPRWAIIAIWGLAVVSNVWFWVFL